jgi:hypothetical protein
MPVAAHRKVIETSRQRFTFASPAGSRPACSRWRWCSRARGAAPAGGGASDGEDFVETFQDAAGYAGQLALHALGEVPDQSLGFGVVV